MAQRGCAGQPVPPQHDAGLHTPSRWLAPGTHHPGVRPGQQHFANLCPTVPVLRVPVQRSRAVSRRGVVHPEVAQQTPLPRAAALQQQRGEGSSPAGSRQHLTQFLLPGCTSAQQPFATPTNCSSRTLIAHSKGSAGRWWSDMKSNLGSWM